MVLKNVALYSNVEGKVEKGGAAVLACEDLIVFSHTGGGKEKSQGLLG